MTPDHEEALRLTKKFGMVPNFGYLQFTLAGLAALIAEVRMQAMEEAINLLDGMDVHWSDASVIANVQDAIRARLEEGK